MSNRERLPYVGVSGVVGERQQRTLELLWERLRLEERRCILLGVKAVDSTQWRDTPNKYGKRWYPVGEAPFRSALVPGGDSYGVAQMYLDPKTVEADPTYAHRFVDRVIERGSRWLDAIQFDMLPYDTGDTTTWNALFEHIHAQEKDVIM